MPVYTQQFLSEAPNGGFISISAELGDPSGTLVHTAPASDIDNVWLWLCSTSNSATEVIIEIDDVDVIHLEIPGSIGPIPILQGEPISGGSTIRVRGDTADDIAAFGSVERIAASGTPSTKKFTRQFLSASTNGSPIPTLVPGTLIHTAHATAIDLVWLRIAPDQNNTISANVRVGSVDLYFSVNKDSGPMNILQGIPFTNSTAIYVYPASDNVVVAYGGVDRIA